MKFLFGYSLIKGRKDLSFWENLYHIPNTKKNLEFFVNACGSGLQSMNAFVIMSCFLAGTDCWGWTMWSTYGY